jgi:hypothetical protein
MKHLAALAALGVVGATGLGACGGHDASAASDGGGAASWRVYDIQATLAVVVDAGQGSSFMDFPSTVDVVLAWDSATGRAFCTGGGAHGETAVTAAGNTFETTLEADAPFAGGCGGKGHVELDSVTFALDGETLHGSATGTVSYVTSGATRIEAPVTGTLAGAPAVAPPAFVSPGMDVDPLAGIDIESSEPLPDQAPASVIGAPGSDVVQLRGAWIGFPAGGIHGFTETGVALQYGETYTLQAGGVTDFGGRAPAAPVTFTTRAAPPLIPQDGFESVTGTMFAGAGVLNGGPLVPIAGQTSLLLNTGFGGGFGFLPYDLGPSLAVRLALAAGDKVVRFDAQLIAPDPIDQASFVGTLRWGSPGGTVGFAQNVDGSGFVKTTLPTLGDVYVSPVKTVDLPLPAGAANEITFEIVGQTFSCDAPPSPTVLVLDNLRVE